VRWVTNLALRLALTCALALVPVSGMHSSSIRLRPRPQCTYVGRGGPITQAAAITGEWGINLQVGDLAIFAIETANEVVSLTTPGVFTNQLSSSPQGTGTGGGATATSLTVFWGFVDSTSPTAPISSDSGDHQHGVIFNFRGCAAPTPIDVTAGDTGASSTSVAIPGATPTFGGQLVFAIMARATDLAGGQCASEANADLVGLVERVDSGSTTQNGGGLCAFTGIREPASAYGATSTTLGTASVQARISIALRNP
jgi:hypothetical protein